MIKLNKITQQTSNLSPKLFDIVSIFMIKSSCLKPHLQTALKRLKRVSTLKASLKII